MRTPSGIECQFFYGDYFRGKKQEECRLIGSKSPPNQWKPDLCQSCPVPAILRSNACESMTLYPTIKGKAFGSKKKIVIEAYCSRSNSVVTTPEVGCGICHQNLDFLEKNQK
ncbi:MAG: hypothetical protein NTZ74_07120 [Chloroflexi bacterium]|nr:hypothetical protein [Chloroflexota bacterium]